MTTPQNEEEGFTLTLKGFKTMKQAREFISWYSGQGEQDAAIWFECREDLGTDFMAVDSQKGYTEEGNNLIAHLNMH